MNQILNTNSEYNPGIVTVAENELIDHLYGLVFIFDVIIIGDYLSTGHLLLPILRVHQLPPTDLSGILILVIDIR